jgi:hypothetical protein
MPSEYTKFSDIKLREYSKKPGCQGDNPTLKMKYSLSKKDKLFVDYAENIKNMIQNAADNQYKLLSVINDLFTNITDPYSGKRVIRINPNLNDALLQKSVIKTRRLIVDLYINCEKDYVSGVKLFEAIVESKILSTTEKQIEALKKESTKIIENTKSISAPVIVKPQNVQPQNVQKPPVIIAEPSASDNKTQETQSSTATPISSETSTSEPLKPIPGVTIETSNSLPSTNLLPTNNPNPAKPII